MKYHFSNSSLEKLNSCHEDLILIINEAIKITDVDFGISCGHRTIKVQRQLYAIGRTNKTNSYPVTNCDGILKLSKHNQNPSMAVDYFIATNEKNFRKRIMYEQRHLSYVYGIIAAVANNLYANFKITHLTRWGGNWDKDGVLFYDQSFQDLPHIELYKP